MSTIHFHDEQELAEFVAAFEDTSLPKERWTHAAHVVGATVYLRRYGRDALPKMREAIRRFNRAKGGPETAYHETITVFWLAVVAEALAREAFAGDVAAVHAMVAIFGDERRLHERYYSFDVIQNDEARQRWKAPDRVALAVPFDCEG